MFISLSLNSSSEKAISNLISSISSLVSTRMIHGSKSFGCGYYCHNSFKKNCEFISMFTISSSLTNYYYQLKCFCLTKKNCSLWISLN